MRRDFDVNMEVRMSNKVNPWRVFLHGFGVHFWGEWSQKYEAISGKLHYDRFRFCQMPGCGHVQKKRV